MSKKKIIFKPKIELDQLNKRIDDWVLDKPTNTPETLSYNNEKKENKIDEARFTIVIPEYLHRRIKKQCASEGISIKEKLTNIFEKEFPLI